MDNGQEPDSYNDAEGLAKRFSEWDKALGAHWHKWRVEAKMCFEMVAGNQWETATRADLKEAMVAPITINHVGPMVDAVAGVESLNRKRLKFYPREMGDVNVNDVLTQTADWVRDECDAQDEEADSFLDSVICGMGWVETRMDYDQNPDGNIIIERVDPLEILPDPAVKKRNCRDARYIRRQKEYTKAEFREMFPEWSSASLASDGANPSEGISTAGDDYALEDMGMTGSEQPNMVVVSEYQWYDNVKMYMTLNPATGQMEELPEMQFLKLNERLVEMGGEPLDSAQRNKRVYWRAYVANGQVLDMHKIDKGEFTYKCITGKRDLVARVWYGIVRSMVDPQRWANKWMTQILNIMNKNAKGGILAEEGAFTDDRQAAENWARPEGIVSLAPGGIGKVKEKPQAAYPQGYDRLLQVAQQSISEVTGINKEMLGQATGQQVGLVEVERKHAGYKMLSQFFNALTLYRKESGRLLLKFINDHISDGRLVRVIGMHGQVKYIPLIRDEEQLQYDVIVDEADNGPYIKEKTWASLVQLMPMLERMGLPQEAWLKAAEYSPLPQSLIQEISALLSKPPSPEQQQAAQAAKQKQDAMFAAGLRNTEAQTQKVLSEAAENKADTHKKIVETEQERVDTQLKKVALASGRVKPQLRIS